MGGVFVLASYLIVFSRLGQDGPRDERTWIPGSGPRWRVVFGELSSSPQRRSTWRLAGRSGPVAARWGRTDSHLAGAPS